MAGKGMVVALGVGMITTLINAGIFVGQFSTSANARAAATAGSKLLDDDDFTAGLTNLIRKTVRDYCSVGKKEQIDCKPEAPAEPLEALPELLPEDPPPLRASA